MAVKPRFNGPPDLPAETQDLIAALMGPPLAVLWAMAVVNRPVDLMWIEINVRLSHPTAIKTMRFLDRRTYTEHVSRYGGWTLTKNIPAQLLLFLPHQLEASAPISSQNFELESCSSGCINILQEDKELTTTTTISSQNFELEMPPLAACAQSIVDGLTFAGCSRKSAEKIVRAALAERPDANPEDLADLVDECLAYATAHPYDRKARTGIKMPGIWAASRIEHWDGPPVNGNGHVVDEQLSDVEARKRYYYPPGYEGLINPELEEPCQALAS